MAKDTLKIHKGELVVLVRETNRPNSDIGCWRLPTEKENEAWLNYVRQSPIDDAGEPRIRSSNFYTTDFLPPNTPAIVIKARCTANIGWSRYGSLVQVLVPSNGNTYYVQRKYVAKSESNENSVPQ